jgi:hypothetical protein
MDRIKRWQEHIVVECVLKSILWSPPLPKKLCSIPVDSSTTQCIYPVQYFGITAAVIPEMFKVSACIFRRNNGLSSQHSDSPWAGRSGDWIPVGARFSAPVQTSPGVHPVSYTKGTGSFPGVKRPGRGADHPPPSSIKAFFGNAHKKQYHCGFSQYALPWKCWFYDSLKS